jgi:hypothetical protein
VNFAATYVRKISPIRIIIITITYPINPISNIPRPIINITNAAIQIMTKTHWQIKLSLSSFLLVICWVALNF